MKKTPSRKTLVLRDCRAYTGDPSKPPADTILLRGGSIEYAGSFSGAPGIGGEEIGLEGRTVLPGFTDSHIHLAAYSMGLLRADLRGIQSLDAALKLISGKAAGLAPGEWALGRGWLLRGFGLPSFPGKEMLDSVLPDRPAAMSSMDGHVLWVNSAALAAAGIRRDTPSPEGGEIEKGPDGEPTGILKEKAADMLKDRIPADPPGAIAAALEKGQANLHAFGVTSVHDMEKKKALRAFTRMRRSGRLRLRVRYFIDEGELDHAREVGIEGGFGDDLLRITGVKAYADGALLAETAWMLKPYGAAGARGIPVTDLGSLERLVARAAEYRLPLAVHAIGDAANRMVLDAYETAGAGLEFPYRVEHAQHLDPADLPRFAGRSVTASIQPIHLSFDLDQVDRVLGGRASGAYRIRSLLDSGVRVVFGSDAPVADPNPWLGIHAAVNRTRADGTPAGGWFPLEKITVSEAIAAYTSSPAAAAGDGGLRGLIAPGQAADLCVLDRDPFEIDPSGLREVRPVMTIFGGEVVFDETGNTR